MKKQTVQVLVVALVFLQVYSLLKINSLQRSIENTNSTVYSVGNNLEGSINSIYSTMDSILSKQASLIHSADLEIGKLDADTLTVPITFTVEPKAVTETMSVYLDFNGEILNLEKSGMKFLASKSFKISEEVYPEIIIEDNGVRIVEENSQLNVYDMKQELFPYIYAHFLGERFYKSNKYYEKGLLSVDYKASSENIAFVTLKYVVKIDDEVVKETPVKLKGNTFTLDIDDNYAAKEGQIITSYIIAQDSLGFVHECLVTHFVAGSNMQREPYFEELKITAPNGETVYMFDENR